jgi:hypothetical protein
MKTRGNIQFIEKLLLSFGIAASFLACGSQEAGFTQTTRSSSDFAGEKGEGDPLGNRYGPDGQLIEAEGSGENGNPSGEELGSTGGNNKINNASGNGETFQDPNFPGVEIPGGYELVAINLEQTGSKEVDILWVVDSSGSMKEEQSYLGNNFGALISSLASSDADFQTAVTTSDICHATNPPDLADIVCPVNYGGSASTQLRGSFVGPAGRKVLKKDDADLINMFKSHTSVGTSGSGFEHGLQAAKLAVEKAKAGQNENFLRSDAFLSVIVVSDEEDDGIGLGMVGDSGKNYVDLGLTTHKYTHNDLISYLNGIKGKGMFAVSTITGTRNSDGSLCTSNHSKPTEEGTQYIAAAQATGGIVQSICDANWNKSLGEIGADLKAQISQIPLEKKAFPATIQVFVNGVKTSKFTYVEGSNVIKFDADSVPAPGSMIEVKFYAEA